MIQTGISKLDEYLKGGVPYSKSLIYYTSPGIEGNVFGMQTLYTNLSVGKKCVLVASSSNPQAIRDLFREFGWDLNDFSERLFIIDAYSGLVGLISGEKYLVEDPENIDSITDMLGKVMEELGENVIFIFESLSNVLDLCGEKKTLNAIENWNKYGVIYDNVLIYNFTTWPYQRDTLEAIKHELFDAVIIVGGIGERVIFGQYFGILKADWSDIQPKSMLFRVLRPGGIRIYIPNILVTVPYDAGKSTIINAVSTRSVSVDWAGTF